MSKRYDGNIHLNSVYLTPDMLEISNPSLQGSEMHVQLIGLEKSAVRYTSNSGKHSSTHTAHAQRSLIQAVLPVNPMQMIQNGRILPGKYILPFDIELPEFLPTSMSASAHGSTCQIVYQVKAVLKGSGMLYNYKCDRAISVKAQPLEKVVQPFEGEPSSVKVKLCCCLNRGTMTVGAHMEDTVLEKGETAKLSLSCRNNSTVRVQKVEANLTQIIQWHAGGHSASESRILQAMDFGTQGLDRKAKLLQRGESVRGDQIQILEELQRGANSHTVTMPPNAFNTYQGQVMSIHHELRINVTTNCCIDNPQVIIPIRTGESGNASTSRPPSTAPHADLTESAMIPQGFSENAVQSSVVYMPSGQVYTGGAAVDGENDEFVISAVGEAAPISLETLFKEMNESVADLEIVRKRIADPSWASIFQTMSPTDYGKMIKLVDLDFDQPKVAAVVAEQIPNVTCQYVVAAVRAASEWNRTTMVEKLVPLCTDVVARKQIILAELSDWDTIVTERVFQKALGQV
jgi:hypothetical protein